MSKLRHVMGGNAQPGLKVYKKGGLVEGSKKEEAMDKKQGVKMKCGGKVKGK